MIKTAMMSRHKLSVPQICLIVVVAMLVVVVGSLMLRSYFSSAGTATAFEEAGYATTNLSNIQREALLLRIETHALFSDFNRGFEPIESSARNFKPVELRRDFLEAQLRVAAAQASENADALAGLDQVRSTLAEYDSLLASVRADPTFDRSAAIAQFDEVLIRLGRQVKAFYDRQEIRFFRATADSLRAMRSAHILLLVVGAMMLALFVVLAASLRQSVGTAFKRAYGALEVETKERRRVEEAERRLVEEKVVVDEVARIITSTLDIDQVYERFAAEVKKLVDFDRMSISLYDRRAGVFTMKHTVGQEVPGQHIGETVPLEGTPTQVAIDTGRTVLISDTADGQYTTDQRFLKAGLRSMLLVRLTYRGSTIGGMALRSTNIGVYGLREQVILERLAHQIAPAVANAELFEQSKRAEEAMRQSEAGAKALLESASQGVVVANRDGEIVQINASALDMFGYGRDELVGQPVERLVPDSVRDIHGVQRNSYFNDPVSRPMGLGFELSGRRKDGTCFPAEISLSSITTDGDTLALAFIADISERKQAEEAQRRWAVENSVMAEIGRVISSSLDINDIYHLLGQEIRKLITFDRMTVSMFDQEDESICQTWVLGTEVPGRGPGARIPLAGTFAEEVIRTRSAIMLEADNEPDLRQRFPGLLLNFRAGMRSFLAAPLIHRDDVIGILQLRSKERGVYSQPNLDLAERVANQIAGAIANSHLYAERKRLAEENSVMAEIGRVISSSLDINEVYDRLGVQTGKLVPFDHMSLSLIDQENGVSTVTWVFGEDIPDRGPGDIVPLAGGFVNEVVLARSPVMLEVDTEVDLLSKVPRQLPAFRAGMRSFLGVPLLYRDDLIGVLQLQSKEQGIYSQRDLDLAERVGNQIVGAVANSQLYAERVQAEEAMRVSEQKYRTLVNQSPDMIFVSRIDDFRFTEVNNRACEHYGYTRQELLAMNIFDIEVEPPLKEEVRSLYDNTPVGHVVEVYGTNKRKDGTTFPVHVRFAKLNDMLAIANVRDITERKEAEERIKASLEEKEILLKEINHRVKNNLQIVSSLLNLGSRDIQDGQAQEMLDESQARIRAMALIHEKLYQSEDLARIDFGEYLRSLTSELRRSHGFNAQDIELKLDADHTLLGVDTAIPCGLIVNEMVSNSFKHAFPSGSGGEISIALRLEDQEYSLVVRDSGVGFPEDFDIRRSNTLGLKLVVALVDQLGGTIELHRNGGAEVSITFPVS